jgi:CO/xanthine dehydrogenase Mo-binding subunit
MHLYPEELLCAWPARELGSPVKWWESRSESHQATSHGRAHTERLEIAFQNDGRILGLKVETLGNVGAYLSNMASGGPTVNTVNFGTIELHAPATINLAQTFDYERVQQRSPASRRGTGTAGGRWSTPGQLRPA